METKNQQIQQDQQNQPTQQNLETKNQKKEQLEFLVWATLYNVQKHKGVSFVSLYKTLGITQSNHLWYGPKICWSVGQGPEFGKMVNKKSRGTYELSPFGQKILDNLSKRFGEKFGMEQAEKLYQISQVLSAKELKEFAKSIEEA